MLICGLAGCPPATVEETAVELPDTDTWVDTDTGLGSFPVDTALTNSLNDEPEHTLTMNQWGLWELSPPFPSTGPYTSLTGDFFVQEYIDGEIPDPLITDPDDERFIVLECDVVYSITGIPAEEDCTGCSGHTFVITFAVTSGNPDACHDSDLPRNGDTRTYGFNDGDQSIYHDFQDAGLWFAWYSAIKTGDQVAFDWVVTVGVAIEEEDD